MSQRDPSAYVWDVLDAVRSIELVLGTRGRAEYQGDLTCRLAIERLLITIGEAVSRLGKLDPSMAAELGDTGKIVAFRNTLVHGYFKIDHGKVWEVLGEHLPRLKTNAEHVWSRFAPLYPPADQP